jgi:hypothetical protein
MTPSIGQQVRVPRNGYFVHGTVEVMFFSAVFTDGPAPAAVVCATESAGLYKPGTLFIAPLAELEAVA